MATCKDCLHRNVCWIVACDEDEPCEHFLELRHGEWIDDCTDIICSECNAKYSEEIAFMNRGFKCEKLKFCPNCGTDMRDKQD